jgi:hypothetical protein
MIFDSSLKPLQGKGLSVIVRYAVGLRVRRLIRSDMSTDGRSTDVTYVDVPVLLRNKFLGIYMV